MRSRPLFDVGLQDRERRATDGDDEVAATQEAVVFGYCANELSCDDDLMRSLQRKITYRLYPNATERAELERHHALHCRVTNTLIEEHRRRHEAGEPFYGFAAMCKDVAQWRTSCKVLDDLNGHSLQMDAKRVALAFAAFFRRLKSGEDPGYPRFKSADRFSGWGYKQYGCGWKLVSKLSSRGNGYGAIRLSGIGTVSMRGKGRFTGSPVTCEIQHKAGKWYASVTFEVAEHQLARPGGSQSMAFDWGIESFLTIAEADGSIRPIENPRWLKRRLDELKVLQRAVSVEQIKAKAQLGLLTDQPIPKGVRLPVTPKLKRLYRQVVALHGKISRQRKDFHHKLAAELVETYGLIGSEQLAVKNMTRAPKAKPDPETPGDFLPNGAAAKAGLNRAILDGAPSQLLGLVKTKAEEAGSRLQLADTREVKPTQRCHRCGTLVRKTLSDRTHICACGCVCGRDENAARTLLRWLLEGEFWKQPDPLASGLLIQWGRNCPTGNPPPAETLPLSPAATRVV